MRAEKWSIFADLDSTEEKRIWEVDCIPALYAFPAFSEDPEPPSCRKCVVEIADAILKENGIEVRRDFMDSGEHNHWGGSWEY